MHTNDSYGKVLFVHANRFPSKQKISGTQHHFNQMRGTDTRWEPVINMFYWTRHFGSPESVPHIYFVFHAESMSSAAHHVQLFIKCAIMSVEEFMVWECKVCGFVYKEEKGDEENGGPGDASPMHLRPVYAPVRAVLCGYRRAERGCGRGYAKLP